jgi:hypothetical protein
MLIGSDYEHGDNPDLTETSQCHCESCKYRRLEDSKLRYAVIRSYGYRPANWSFKKLPNDKYDYYLGVELETDNHDGPVKAIVSPSIASSMKRPARFWVVKRDSSVSGPEFASHPATLSYWKSKKPEIAEMLRMLTHAGYRSYRNGNCGIHVNISNTAFSHPSHMYRFLSLIYLKTDWALKMSQRSWSQVDRWASLDNLKNAHDRQRAAKSINSIWDRGVTGKYSAVNIPYESSGRIEFRLPRGTLRLDRFYKNLEWTVAMIEYTRNVRLLQSTPSKFMDWCRTQRAEFPNLVSFLDEKFPVS